MNVSLRIGKAVDIAMWNDLYFE